MDYFASQLKKSYCAVLITVFYILLQAFVLLADGAGASPNLLDVKSVNMMQTIKSVNDEVTVAQRAPFAHLFAAFGFALQPKALTDAFSEGLCARFGRLPAWASWLYGVGAEQEARAPSDMVSRK